MTLTPRANRIAFPPRGTDRVTVWDWGPDKPVAPPEPPIPVGVDGDPAHELAKVRFKYEIPGYDAAYGAYHRALKDYEAFAGTPKQIIMAGTDAKEAILHDPKRYSFDPPPPGMKK